VTVVAPTLSSEMETLAPELSGVERRPYQDAEAAAYRLVVSATGLPDVDGAVFADADAAGVWVNSADDPSHCSFILPAVYRDGAVTVSVSTGGLSPAFASWLRDRLAASLGPGLGELASLLAEARARLRSEGAPSDAVDWQALLNGPLLELVRSGDFDNARATIHEATTTSEQL
jgi:siroheme synthase-like protein